MHTALLKEEPAGSAANGPEFLIIKEEGGEEDFGNSAPEGKRAVQCPALPVAGERAPGQHFEEEWARQHAPAGGAEELPHPHSAGRCVDHLGGFESVLKADPEKQEVLPGPEQSAGSVASARCSEYGAYEGASGSYSDAEADDLEFSYASHQQGALQHHGAAGDDTCARIEGWKWVLVRDSESERGRAPAEDAPECKTSFHSVNGRRGRTHAKKKHRKTPRRT
ncbi:hypothetical protein AAFF_G00293520 [Aldrovandia affinis]|uniref:Uncharacterized protein n=1 Tax=Aldrovandia affinis TaxID=143900 RepID=A0AAD7R9B9_9TELE|nr:hypothetical protein AAFF_G00293520 [Aldrovandia affinis]